MKGLLTKDMMIVRRELRTLLLLAVFGVLMSFTASPAFAMFYVAMIGGMMALGTMAYDEADHGFSFLLTLPVSRRDYVREKFLFCGIWSLGLTVVAAALCLIIGAARGAGESGEVLTVAGMALGVVWLMEAIMIPMRLKYGSEKSRIVLYAVAALIAGVGLLLRRLAPDANPEAGKKLDDVMALIAPVAALAVIAVSERISEGIMMRKEF